LTPAVPATFAAGLALALGAGCAGPTTATYGPLKVDIPVSDGARSPGRSADPARQSAPPSGVSKEAPFPAIARSRLANGMGLAVVTSRALPIVQLRVVLRAGSGFGPTPAVAALTAAMTKDGGTRAMSSAELLRRVETLGADLSVRTDFDATVLAMAVTREQLGEGLALLAQVIREPRFDADELKKHKARAVDEAEDAARSSGGFMTTRLVFRELFPEKSAYAGYQASPAEIAKVDGAAVRQFHRSFYVPKAATLVLAGDVDAVTARALAERDFGSWTGGEPPTITFAPPRLPAKTRVIVAHRPKSAQSDVSVATLAPARASEGWASARVASQILGGGVASRLFADVRERRSLAYSTGARVLELGHGEQPLVAHAGTETARTTEVVAALLENLTNLTSSPPSSSETARARRYLSDVFAIRMETVGAIADLVVTQDTFGLPDGYWDIYRRQLRAAEAPEVALAATKLYTPDRALIVVAGDADVIAPELAKFGDVTVVDPEKEWKTMRTIPQEPR
jgi:predicted Zn-dependent peptidase